MDIVYQLVSGLSGLPAQESRLARFFLENFSQVPESTMEELAARAGVSSATLHNFARSIGCRDINDFLGRVRHQQQDISGSPLPSPSGILGDAAWVEPGALQQLAAKAGVSSDILARFTHSTGKEGAGDILARIRSRLGDFSQQEARVAQTILDDVAFACSATIDQLASAAGVSPATITRFARASGCDDIRDLRMKLAQSSQPAPAGGLPQLWRNKLQGVTGSLGTQLGELSPATLQQAVTALQRASGVHIFSAGAADTPFASLLQYRLLTQSLPASLCLDPALMSITASMLRAGQALVIVAGNIPEPALMAAAYQARLNGAAVIVIASLQSPIIAKSDIVLPLTDSYYGTLLIIDLICEMMSFENED